MFRNLLLLSAALVSAAACLPLQAGSLVDIDLVDRDSGHQLPEYDHRGRTYVPGEPGHRYAVRLRNQTGERLLVVLSVDGVNAVTGETASPSQAGYVLSPWESAEITGWRKSLDDVAQFYFTDLPDSYAARTGRPDDVGVIGIAVFRERQRYLPYPMPGPPVARGERERDGAQSKSAHAPSVARESAATGAAHDAIAEQRIGTGHGEREWAPISRTDFVRASLRPAQITQLHYDAGEALAAMGVMPRYDWRYGHGNEPRAFPNGFVADPPGW